MLSDHSCDRRLERSARPVDIVTAIINGLIGTAPVKGRFRSELKFRIDGYDTEGVALGVVVALDVLLRRLTIVTVCGHNGDAGGNSGIAAYLILIAVATRYSYANRCSMFSIPIY